MLSSIDVSALDTGDIMLFSGKGLGSAIIRWFTGSDWTHVAMVVRLDGVDEPLLLESNPGPESADLFCGQPVAGISLVTVARKLTDYRGEVVVRRREGAPIAARQHRLVQRLVRRLYRRPYRGYLWRQLRDVLRSSGRRDYSAMFCSELVAEFYRRLDWLPREVRTGRVVPAHFATDGLPLLQGALRPPVWLKSSAEKKSSLAVAGR